MTRQQASLELLRLLQARIKQLSPSVVVGPNVKVGKNVTIAKLFREGWSTPQLAKKYELSEGQITFMINITDPMAFEDKREERHNRLVARITELHERGYMVLRIAKKLGIHPDRVQQILFQR